MGDGVPLPHQPGIQVFFTGSADGDDPLVAIDVSLLAPDREGHQVKFFLQRRGCPHMIIGCGSEIIARHPRSYDRADLVFDPIHYLPLLERKIGALDQAAPLIGWDLPEAFATLRRLLEARMGKAGKREYVQVLRLLETFDLKELHGAVRDALRLGAIGYDAVKHLLLCRVERRPPKLDLDVYRQPAVGFKVPSGKLQSSGT